MTDLNYKRTGHTEILRLRACKLAKRSLVRGGPGKEEGKYVIHVMKLGSIANPS